MRTELATALFVHLVATFMIIMLCVADRIYMPNLIKMSRG